MVPMHINISEFILLAVFNTLRFFFYIYSIFIMFDVFFCNIKQTLNKE